MNRVLLALALVLMWPPVSLRAEEAIVVEETFLSVDIKGKPFKLQALVVKEAGLGRRLPVALITHGQAAKPEGRERVEARSFLRFAREFARRGWLAVVVVRRGFGRSEGALPFALRGCRDGDYGPMLDQQADDLEAALRALAKRPDVNADQALALGISVGGATALALGARPPDGLKAVINVSGGVRPVQADGGAPVPCKPEDLAPTFARLGERSRVPSLWLYAENDSLFPGDYVRQLHEAYVSKGGPTDFHMFESLGKDGHEMAGTVEGALRWLPALDRFLRANRLPTYDPAPLDAAVAALNLGNSPARLVAARYAGRPTEKVLTVAPASRGLHAKFGGTDLAELERQAIAECAERLKAPCRVLLRNFEVVNEEGAKEAGSPPP